jgi:hypothetical protein
MNINIISFQNKFEVGADAVSCPYMVKYFNPKCMHINFRQNRVSTPDLEQIYLLAFKGCT